jgi:hypothetical protein
MIEILLDYPLPNPLVDADEASPATWLRLTIGPCSTVAYARYQQYAREASAYCLDVLGLEAGEEAGDAVARAQVQAAWARAIMLASLLRLEVGESTNGDAPSDWEEQPLPDRMPERWRTVAGFVEAVPQDLADEWVIVAIRANRGLFVSGEELEKKRVRLSVRSSMKRWNGS